MFFSTACQKVGLYLANSANEDDAYHAVRDIAYGGKPWQQLNVYTPSNSKAKTHPVIVFFYGGGWSQGDRTSYEFVADTLAREGFVVVIPDYAKYPEARYPDFQIDAALATRWVKDNVAEHGGDAGDLHMIGHSAGAHIGAMLLADRSFLNDVDLTPDVYRSFVGISGPYHFTPGISKFKTIFGPPENYSNMQASHFVDGDEPPMLLMHANNDTIVGYSNIERFSAAIEKAQGSVEIKRYLGIGHFLIMGQFSARLGDDKGVVADAVAFMRQHSAKSGAR